MALYYTDVGVTRAKGLAMSVLTDCQSAHHWKTKILPSHPPRPTESLLTAVGQWGLVMEPGTFHKSLPTIGIYIMLLQS